MATTAKKAAAKRAASSDETTKAPEGTVTTTAATVVPPEPEEKGTTTLDSHLDKPSETAPGDGPADTVDPTEIASTVTPDKGAAAQAGHLTVNGVVKVGEQPKAATVAKKDQRVEKYKATRPDGTEVTVTHNIDTGETSVS